MVEKLYKGSLFTATDLPSFQRQETIFIVLNVALMGTLLVLHVIFAPFLGHPSRSLLALLIAIIAANVVELVWVQRLTRTLKPATLLALSWSSICLNLGAAGLLTVLANHEDSPYFTLAVVPVLIAAFRLTLPAVLGVVALGSVLNFWAVEYFFRHHPPADVGEYFEAGISTVIFALVGLLVWLLMQQIREHEGNLARNLLELKEARARLLEEETLAAVGRLSSAIAHEIRNPVAMISSSLAMAKRGQLDSETNQEMYDIAAREASRLEKLTTDFLTYARPRAPELRSNSLHDTLAYVASVCRAHATEKQVRIVIDTPESLEAELDPSQIQQALLNLVMNAIDASPGGSTVRLTSHWDEGGEVRLCVENSGPEIPETAMPRIFEPFFTTKARGTGLGLAIARNIARSHGGELSVVSNRKDNVCFCLRLPAVNARVTAMAART